MAKLLGVVRLRGTVKIPGPARETLKRLNLSSRNSFALYYDTPSIRGMMKRVERFVAWGELDQEFLSLLLSKRGRTGAGHKLNAEEFKALGFESCDALAKTIIDGGLLGLRERGLSNVFHLTPPSKGFEGNLRRPFRNGGVWGDQGKEIHSLIQKMI